MNFWTERAVLMSLMVVMFSGIKAMLDSVAVMPAFSNAVNTSLKASGAARISATSSSTVMSSTSTPPSTRISNSFSSLAASPSTTNFALRWNFHETEPLAPRLQLYLLKKERISAAVRLRLSDRQFTMTATPPAA